MKIRVMSDLHIEFAPFDDVPSVEADVVVLAGDIVPEHYGLYEPLIERCKAEGVEIMQIKEKFGGLRFYVMQGSDELFDAINAAEEESLKLCELCGEPGSLRKTGGWLRTLCDRHAAADA